tara:strand:+ start:124 stop:507 length:384 start_codon:yes stop_codon:yes gene_type:complete
MNLKEVAVMIAQGLLLLFFIYLIGLGIQSPKMFENFEDRSIKPDKLGGYFETMNDNMKEDMNLGKNRDAYQDALTQMHENVNLAMLQTLTKTKGSVPEDDTIDRFHKLHRFKNAVGELQDYLDGARA